MRTLLRQHPNFSDAERDKVANDLNYIHILAGLYANHLIYDKGWGLRATFEEVRRLYKLHMQVYRYLRIMIDIQDFSSDVYGDARVIAKFEHGLDHEGARIKAHQIWMKL